MKHYLNNLKSVFDPEAELGDEGGFLDEIIFMAGIALVATILVNWLGTAATNKGADLAACIEGMNTYDNPNGGAENCSEQNHAKANSFKNDEAYKNRY